ncbi:hypothetical protein [Enterococcus phage ECP3]|uniref:Uncharacterized protein n=2 Tax=Kochikohdavirus TaxID=2560160 RepID=A0A096XTC9_9CAUD|nr:hypothetical protein [Enterococcus phage ECP3]AII28571.1 hypothetical protein [Enterococcus phage ECP3]QBZ69793.1 hypothetical protein [Enterococcus phage vB_EfaM_Ef2.1]
MIIAENELYLVKKPLNEWDMNYHLIEKETGKDFLIDIDEVAENVEEGEKYELGLLFSDLQNLNIELLIENSWKTI